MRTVETKPDGTRRCTKCGLDKPEAEFYKCPSMVSGFRSRCTECERSLGKQNPKTKEQIKNTRLKCAFGITLSDYKRMFDLQSGVCCICGRAETVQNRKGIVSFLSVDHCHKTGKIRGLLCNKCNTGLGKFEDSEEVMLKAVEYLRKHKED